MFMATSEDARVAESAMVGFCTTLNTPVVNVDGLPTGPARAGILLAASEYGDLDLWVRVRLISRDEGVTFKFQGDPAELGDYAAALDAALSFSEGMGFLFEEDMIRGGGGVDAARAHRIWTTLFESEDASFAVRPTALQDADGDDEVWVDSELEDETETGDDGLVLELDPADETVSEAPRPELSAAGRPAATGASVMTKFRKAEPAVNAPPTQRKPGEKALGRVELQSEELGEEYVDHAGFLSRLLGSF